MLRELPRCRESALCSSPSYCSAFPLLSATFCALRPSVPLPSSFGIGFLIPHVSYSEMPSSRSQDLEDRSRRRNLVIFGYTEPEIEDSADLRKRVVDGLFKEKLGVTVTSVERLHRLGAKRGDKPRPVILNFYDYNEKMLVLKNCPKLKGSPISIGQDYCRATLDVRSKLWNQAKEYKSQGRKVSLDYDKLRVDDDIYVWDAATDSIKPIRQGRKPTPRQ